MRLLPAAALTLVVLLSVGAAEPDPQQVQDEALLRDNRVAADGPALVAFFRARTVSAAQKARLADLITKLGDEDFDVREQASAELVKAGRRALPLLKPAVRNRDAEVARRAAECLHAIDEGKDVALCAAAARVLAARKPEGAVAVLLAYLPDAADDLVVEAVVAALGAVGLRDGKADAALVAALQDGDASRRAAAAAVVGRADPEGRKAVVPLLDDNDLQVRFRAADALVRTGSKVGVPALIALVEKGTPSLAWQAEDVLFRIAGSEAQLPALGPGNDGAACRRAWDDWWKRNGAKIDLAKLDAEEAERGITLVCDVNGSVWECDRSGKQLWRCDNLPGAIDAQVLPGGRVLVAERHASRVTERDRKGAVLWEAKTKGEPVSCQRLPSGNTFIATANELLEVTRDGKTVYSRTPAEYVYSATRLRNGHVIYAHNQQGIVELDGAGKLVRKVPFAHQGDGAGVWVGAELLPNGHFLVGVYSENKVVEIDATGKRLWEGSVNSPTFPLRLRNGNTLVPSPDSNKVVELDRNGKEVWSVRTEGNGRPFRVRRY